MGVMLRLAFEANKALMVRESPFHAVVKPLIALFIIFFGFHRLILIPPITFSYFFLSLDSKILDSL